MTFLSSATANGWRELDIAIVLTYLEKRDGAPRNSMSLTDRHGEIVLTYAKVHTCELAPNEATLTRGDDCYVGALDTAAGPVKVGAIICDAGGHSRNTLAAEARESEGVYLARFDLDEIRAYRTRETWGNAFRKPHRYGLLTSLTVEEPFVRVDARGRACDRAKR